MDRFAACVAEVLCHEGGYVDQRRVQAVRQAALSMAGAA